MQWIEKVYKPLLKLHVTVISRKIKPRYIICEMMSENRNHLGEKKKMKNIKLVAHPLIVGHVTVAL